MYSFPPVVSPGNSLKDSFTDRLLYGRLFVVLCMKRDKLKINIHAAVEKVFAAYPPAVCDKMKLLRDLVIETAKETEGLTELEITLKWGEPAFVTKHGSTLRMDWKTKTPDQYAMYFQCTSRLVETFRLLFANKFTFEGNRAIVFKLAQKLPVKELKACIKASLMYHKVKHLVTLGI